MTSHRNFETECKDISLLEYTRVVKLEIQVNHGKGEKQGTTVVFMRGNRLFMRRNEANYLLFNSCNEICSSCQNRTSIIIA